jgi:hydroxymethylbilane synthase
MVEQAILQVRPDLTVELLTRSSLGDRDSRVALWQSPDKGLFTTDLSEALLAGDADIVVHSWKDLPIAGFPGTVVGGTLERADPRDVLLVRREAAAERPGTIDVLTSSPRRTWQLEHALPALLPWPVSGIRPIAVRGNIPTRLERLADGQAHALVVAMAALDRLLSPVSAPDVRNAVRAALDRHLWMVLPLSEFPTAPGQGALALEIPENRPDLAGLVASVSDEGTRRAVEMERTILAGHGGGCHEALGATVLLRDYGVVTSVRGRAPSGEEFSQWSLQPATPLPPPASGITIWPRPDERDRAVRRELDAQLPDDDRGWWVARADAVPDGSRPDTSRLIWAAGTRTWRRLAARGFWVHGCSDGLGDSEPAAIDSLAGRSVAWHRLTHTGSRDADAVATYAVETPLPDDLGSRTHFFWTSGTVFLDAVRRHPDIRHAWHGCGPGRTARTLRDTLGDPSHVSIWLDYEQWHQHVTQ